MSADLEALRRYVTAKDDQQFVGLAEGVVSVNITHSNLSSRMIELKFDLSQTIGEIKGKIYKHCGTNPGMQKLQLRSGGQTLCALTDDSKMLGFYGVRHGMEIHVVDDDPFSISRGGGLEDTSLVQKYRMTEEEYDQREGTLRSWVKEQKAKDPSWVEPWLEKKEGPPPGAESVEGIEVGHRCEVLPGGRRGIVAFVGEVQGLQAGYWVGVVFDEPVGRGDGTVKGKRIFECRSGSGFGGFVRGRNVTTGDFPEHAFDSDEGEM